MKRALAILVIAFAGLTAPATAFACRFNMPPALRVQGNFDAIVVGVVVRAGYYRKGASFERGWSGAAEVRRAILGRADSSVVAFGRSGHSPDCDDGFPPPEAGEEWVFYMSRTGDQLRVAQSYPLHFAVQFDARLRGFPKARP